MRILGTLPHPLLKITAFQHNHRLSLQIEKGLVQINFRFRESEDLKTLADLQRLADQTFLEHALQTLQSMERNKDLALQRFLDDKASEEEFPRIV